MRLAEQTAAPGVLFRNRKCRKDQTVTSQSRQDRGVERQIDENLRRIFEQDVEEDLPDRLRSLLDRLEQDEAGEDDAPPETPDTGEESRDGRRAAAGRRALPVDAAMPAR